MENSTIAINLIFSKDTDGERVTHSKSDNVKTMTYVNGVIEQIFESLLSRYQLGLKTSMKGTNFIFDSVELLYHKCHKVNFKRVGSYIESLNWIKKQESNNKSEK